MSVMRRSWMNVWLTERYQSRYSLIARWRATRGLADVRVTCASLAGMVVILSLQLTAQRVGHRSTSIANDIQIGKLCYHRVSPEHQNALPSPLPPSLFLSLTIMVRGSGTSLFLIVFSSLIPGRRKVQDKARWWTLIQVHIIDDRVTKHSD